MRRATPTAASWVLTADIADHDADGAVLHFDGVEEIATEEARRPPAS